MKNILVLADGAVAKHFIEWMSKKRVAANKYYVVTYTPDVIPEGMPKSINHLEFDPTSFAKMRSLMEEVSFSNVFIVMENKDDTLYSLKNVKLLDSGMRVILVNHWDDESIGRDEEGVTIITPSELAAAHLYDHLPNVPIVAQNVGLAQGEIMEIHVPFGSTYAFRHVGSILQRKWKIVAIYRDEKQILPTNATMIRPNDTLLVVGKPIVLDGVYRTINKRIGLFPEPFGQNLYLILDLRHDKERAMLYLKESLFLLDLLEEKNLYVRVLYPNDFALLDDLKQLERDNVTLSVCYKEEDIKTLIEYDIQEQDVGLVLNSVYAFEDEALKNTLYELRKVVYLFGDILLYNIKECIILMSEKEKMESISSTALDLAESLNLKLTLGDYDPEGEFENRKIIIEHYETLSHIFNIDINIEQKVANPIRELSAMNDVLQIAPFEKELKVARFKRFVSTKVKDFLLTTTHHPKLLVPYALAEN